MIVRAIESVGDVTIRFVIAFYDALFFTLTSVLQFLNPLAYNKQTFNNMVLQIYHTSVSVLPYFLLSASFFGSITIGLVILFSTQYNMQFEIGSIIVTFIFNIFATLFSALFITFRSKHLLKKNRSILNNDEEVIIPAILSEIINMLTLSVFFSIIMVVSAYLFTFFFMGMDFYTYKYLIYRSIELNDIMILLSKGLIFGFSIALISVYSIHVRKKQEVPIKLILVSLFFIEVTFFIIQEVLNVIQ